MKLLPVFILIIFSCGCTEEIREIITKIERDTIQIPVYIKTPPDTIYQVEHIYKDTLYLYITHTTTDIPEELQDIVRAFYADATRFKKTVYGGEIVIEYQDRSKLPFRSWSSYSYMFAGQYTIVVADDIPPRFLYSSIYRELARLQDLRIYEPSGDVIMNPLFDPYKLTLETNNEEYLKELFK
jgi:hypothetical protein